jgi:homoserine O-acetyltransferase/O-succinyltransferase
MTSAAADSDPPKPTEANFILQDFHFASGEHMHSLRMHYATLGSPIRNKAGEITNAVLILHSTANLHQQFFADRFAGVLFGPGQPLDVRRYFIVLPDSIGHGGSSKPSDGLHAKFPKYDYDDMVAAQHALLQQGLGINHLRLVLGTSMGCMHSWVWAVKYPDFLDAAVPLACLPAPVAGRNRMWRDIITETIQHDPQWQNGEYKSQPTDSLRTSVGIMLIAGAGALELQSLAPNSDAADKYLDQYIEHRAATLDANDLLYAIDSSKNYDPSTQLGKITADVLFVNYADDFINPPELAIAEESIKKIRHGTFVLVPISAETHGHLTHSYAHFYSDQLAKLLEYTAHK